MRVVRFIDDTGCVRLGEAGPRADECEVVEPDARAPSGHRRTGVRRTVRRRLCPVAPVNIYGIGLNYRRHAAESGMPVPSCPVVFMKPTTASAGPDDPIELPGCCDPAGEVDYEVELAVVIGKSARDVRESNALEHVAGYTIANDLSARTIQLRSPGGQWTRGKGFDGFCPMGPVMVTADEIPDPQALGLRTVLNGRVVQESTTADMIFPVARIISFLSAGTTLLPGTVILTGTPEGVGLGRKPPVYLRPGDRLALEIAPIGTLENPLVGPRQGGTS